MKRTQELFENIDAYLKGDLKGEDLELFENALRSDVRLQEEVKKYELVKDALKDEDIIKFREKLRDIDHEIEQEKISATIPKKSFKQYYKIAAVFIAILGISSLLWLFNPLERDLYAEYYVPYPISELTRSNEVTTIAELKEVSGYYKRKEYVKTIPILETLTLKYPKNDKLRLYLGNSYLNTNQEEKAIYLFENVLHNDTFRNDALWFLSLTHIKEDNKDKAIILLKDLASYENLYKKSAIDLLEDLR